MNAEVGWWTRPDWGMRVSGLFLGDNGGVQASLCRTIQRSATRRTAVALVAGTMHSGGSDQWTYAGAAMDWNLRGLFLEAGLVYGDGHLEFGGDTIESGVQLVAQLGFLNGGGVHGPR